jgi:glycosyltransferase involved in cell wall biosynthesis
MPRVIIGATLFNHVEHSAPALDSILAQTFRDFELIVINDGSTDETERVLRRFIDARLRVVTTTNGGIVAACNEGLKLSKGELVFRMDADDVAHPERFAAQVKYMAEHPNCVALGTDVLVADPDLRPLKRARPPTDHAAIDEQHLRGDASVIAHPSCVVRRAAVAAVAGLRRLA